MQSAALRSAARRAVGISSSRRRVAAAAASTTKAATATTTASMPERDLVAENEKAWVAAMVQREVRAQMAAEEERRIARDRLRAEAEEWRAARRLADKVEPLSCNCACSWMLGGWVVGSVFVTLLLFGR